MSEPLYFEERAAFYRELAMNTKNKSNESALSGLGEIFEQLATACALHPELADERQHPRHLASRPLTLHAPPRWVESNTWCPLFVAAMTFAGSFFHRKGCGLALVSAKNRLIAAWSSTTGQNTPLGCGAKFSVGRNVRSTTQ